MLELYIPKVEDMWFAQKMQEDPDTMAYNAGWDVSFAGFHPETGCIDLPESAWADKHARLVGREPECFYAFVREKESGDFVGTVNFRYDADGDWHDMGVVLYAPCKGRGYGTMAMEMLLHHAFVVCGVEKLHNEFETTRTPAIALHEKFGFRRVGTGSMKRFGVPTELMELELTREEYLKKKQNF